MVQKLKYMMVACFLMVATACMALVQQKPGDGEQPRDGKRPRPNMEQVAGYPHCPIVEPGW